MQAPAITSSSKSSVERAVLAGHQLEQRQDVAGVQLRGVLGHARRQVQRRGDRRRRCRSCRSPPAWPARSCRPPRRPGRRSPRRASCRPRPRRRRASAPGGPGTSAVVMITSDLPICTVSAWRWVSCSSGRQLAGVAALGLGVAEALDLEELRAERLDLLLDGGADVEGGDDGAEPARGGDRLQAGDAGAEHEHLGGRDRARGGHQHREEAAASPARRSARRGSRATVAWLESASIDCAREMRGIASIANAVAPVAAIALMSGAVGQRAEEADQHGLARRAGRSRPRRRDDLGDDVGAPRVADRRAGLGELARRGRRPPRPRRPRPRPRGRRRQAPHDVGDERHAALAGGRLLGDSDSHRAREPYTTRSAGDAPPLTSARQASAPAAGTGDAATRALPARRTAAAICGGAGAARFAAPASPRRRGRGRPSAAAGAGPAPRPRAARRARAARARAAAACGRAPSRPAR